MDYKVFQNDERMDLLEQEIVLNNYAWPLFVKGEKVLKTYWGFMLDKFPDHQLMLVQQDKIISMISSAGIYFSDSDDKLSDRGLYWGLKKMSHDYYRSQPNTLIAFQVIISPEFKGQGYSYCCARELKKLGRDKGYRRLIIPLRPSLKHLYPLIDMQQYFHWKNSQGLPFDPWLRVHVKEGARLVKTCNGITIAASQKEWEEWTNLKIPYSGDYIIPGALNPVHADLEKDLVLYEQQNVWAVYDLS